ncbi:MAG: YesL family protein [Propionibacteriaceae bacterium]|jgi:uncharacterized membrane protein YesL|nr:YesL family protein [Propionibacteriaceae bacterium]
MSSARTAGPVGPDVTAKVFRAATEAGYIVVASVLWLVAALPLVTLGAATAGLFAVLRGHVEDGDRAYARPFFRAFRARFGAATALWLAGAAVLGAVGLSLRFYLGLSLTAGPVALAVVQGALFVTLATVLLTAFALLSRPTGPTRALAALSAAAAALRHRGPWTLLIAATLAGVPALLTATHLWQFAPFAPGVIGYVTTQILKHRT